MWDLPQYRFCIFAEVLGAFLRFCGFCKRFCGIHLQFCISKNISVKVDCFVNPYGFPRNDGRKAWIASAFAKPRKDERESVIAKPVRDEAIHKES